MKLNPYFIPYTKMNSREIKDLKVTAKTINLRRKWEKLHNTGFGSYVLVLTPKVQAANEKYLHKMYNLCALDIINRVKILEEIFLNHIFDKKLKSRIYEELLQLKNNTNKTKNNWVEK